MQVQIVEITEPHNDAVRDIIKRVGAEFGAIGEGFGPSDDEVNAMSAHYSTGLRSLYLIALLDGKVVGGCGVAPLGRESNVCELKKLFLLPESRGNGIGKALTTQCLSFAKEQGFTSCYLDTLAGMKSAIHLYESVGFQHLDKPYPGTLHNGCDVWMTKSLL
ncbi:GNAT family N-acetyltransferase [Vibrio nomapromontoriensis]|uniref:GNAT family N-acetyltransferase n=1 Tax=Vibrio nomapromontoriensis TaxID=2910246 RepID=UPI003D10B4AC